MIHHKLFRIVTYMICIQIVPLIATRIDWDVGRESFDSLFATDFVVCTKTFFDSFFLVGKKCSETVQKLFRNCSENVQKMFRNCSENVSADPKVLTTLLLQQQIPIQKSMLSNERFLHIVWKLNYSRTGLGSSKAASSQQASYTW